MAIASAPPLTQLRYLLGTEKVTNQTATRARENQIYGVVRAVNIMAHQYLFGSGAKTLAKIIFTAFDWADFYKFPIAHSESFINIAKTARVFKDAVSGYELFSEAKEILKPLSRRDVRTGAEAGIGEQLFRKASQISLWIVNVCDGGLFYKAHKFIHPTGKTGVFLDRAIPLGYLVAGTVSCLRGLYEVEARVETGRRVNPDGNAELNNSPVFKDHVLAAIETLFYTSILGLTWIMGKPQVFGMKYGDNSFKFWKNLTYTGTIVGIVGKYFWEKVILREPV
jgi:hypothetical protein